MRDKVINSLNMLIWVLAALIVLGSLGAGFAAMAQGQALYGLVMIAGGVIYAIILCGMIFLFLDIRDNTRRTAEAVEALNKR
jgi:Mn2+/Fe2+ NRAMP family transporter